MVNSMVERATSDMLIGPDWAMNIEICDMLNQDQGQAKDVVKGIKKRLGSRNSKVQLLALTLLETVIKNCGDVVHMHVAEKDVLHEMVRIVKKKPDFHVKEKILVLIDTWQEAFGGPRARYPQYYTAYQELLRAGAVFPQRSEKAAAPVFTPPQTQPLTSYPPNIRNPEYRQDVAESSADSEFPSLSMTEIQNARGIMDVLSEMLNAIDPGNREGLRQEVIVDLVDQCRTYKQRVVHLVNSTVDESLLCQGLALNDDLQRLLSRHEAIASGTAIPTEKLKCEPSDSLVDVESSLIDTGDSSKQPDKSSNRNANLGTQLPLLSLAAPPTNNGAATPPVKLDPKIDLLSGDDYNSPTASANTLALVPVGEPQSNSPASEQNALVLADFYLSNNNNNNNNNTPISNNPPSAYPAVQTYPLTPSFQQHQYPNDSATANSGLNPYEQSMYTQPGANPAWNNQISQQQPSSHASYGAQPSGSLPPPPWEAQPVETSQPANTQMQGNQSSSLFAQPQPMGNSQVPGMYSQPMTGNYFPATNNQQFESHQFTGFQPHTAHNGQMMGAYPLPMQSGNGYNQQMYENQMGGYAYNQQQEAMLQQRMYNLSMREESNIRNSSYQGSTASYVPPNKPSKPEDKLFGDLVDISKFKPTKSM